MILGLRNLSFMEEIIDHVMKLEGKKIDLSKIPFNDKETFKLLGKR
ncbi:hypothetical protein KHA80_16320 [Anaerobacillus sp. HL2]|nr:hypothetical protein KHA80_16320 [Anaerobacillus sp. HL2]